MAEKKDIYTPPVAMISLFRTNEILTASNDDTSEDDFENW